MEVAGIDDPHLRFCKHEDVSFNCGEGDDVDVDVDVDAYVWWCSKPEPKVLHVPYPDPYARCDETIVDRPCEPDNVSWWCKKTPNQALLALNNLDGDQQSCRHSFVVATGVCPASDE